MAGDFVSATFKSDLDLDARSAMARAGLLTVAEALEQALTSRARAKADGGVLKNRTGRHVAAIHGNVKATESGVRASVSSDAPGAALLEYGGVVGAHTILPSARGVLKLALGGSAGEVYAKAVHMPDVRHPPHSVLQSSLDDMHDEIETKMAEAVEKAFK